MMKREPLIKCEACGHQFAATNRICPECRAALPAWIKCPTCGTIYRSIVGQCPACHPPKSPISKYYREHKGIFLAAIIFLIAILFIFIASVVTSRQGVRISLVEPLVIAAIFSLLAFYMAVSISLGFNWLWLLLGLIPLSWLLVPPIRLVLERRKCATKRDWWALVLTSLLAPLFGFTILFTIVYAVKLFLSD